MTDRKYAVAFGGELIEGVTAAGVRERLSRIWSTLQPAQIEALMGSKSATLKLFADRETADRFVGFMRQAGMVCWLRLLRPGEETSPMLAELEWSAADSDALLAAASTPAPAPRRRVAPRAALGPKAMTAMIALLLCGAAAYWIVAPGSGPKKRNRGGNAVAAQSAQLPAEPASEVAEASPAPTPAAHVAPTTTASRTLMVPEPLLISARDERAPKPAPAAAEAAKLESATPMPAPTPTQAPTPAHVPPVVFAPGPGQTVAMNKPVVPPAPKPASAEAITAPSYDRGKVVQPRYPVQAYRNREQGEVLLSVVVGTDGKPKKVIVDRTSGSNLLDRAAVAAVKGWKFTPGTKNGVPQEAARQVAVGFKLDD